MAKGNDKTGKGAGADDPLAQLAAGEEDIPSLDDLMAMGAGFDLAEEGQAEGDGGLGSFLGGGKAAQPAPKRGLDAFLDTEPAATEPVDLDASGISDSDLDALLADADATFDTPAASVGDEGDGEPISEAAFDALLGGDAEFGAPVAAAPEFAHAMFGTESDEPLVDMPAFDEDMGDSMLAAARFDPFDASSAPASPEKRSRKFFFDLSFDRVEAPPMPEPEPEPVVFEEPEPEPEPVWEPPPPPPPPMFSEEELAAARAAAYADGEAAGRHATMQSLEHRLVRAAEAIAASLPQVLQDRERAAEAFSHEAARIAHALVRRLLPDLTQRYGLGEIEAVVRESLAKAIDRPQILVRVNAELIDQLKPRLDAIAADLGYQGRLVPLGDAGLGDGDVRCDWGEGGAERLTHRAWEELSAVLARVVGTLETAAPAAPTVLGPGRSTAA